MFCPNCGKQIPDDSDFCPFCGKEALKDWTGEGASEEAAGAWKRIIPIAGIIVAIIGIPVTAMAMSVVYSMESQTPGSMFLPWVVVGIFVLLILGINISGLVIMKRWKLCKWGTLLSSVSVIIFLVFLVLCIPLW